MRKKEMKNDIMGSSVDKTQLKKESMNVLISQYKLLKVKMKRLKTWAKKKPEQSIQDWLDNSY